MLKQISLVLAGTQALLTAQFAFANYCQLESIPQEVSHSISKDKALFNLISRIPTCDDNSTKSEILERLQDTVSRMSPYQTFKRTAEVSQDVIEHLDFYLERLKDLGAIKEVLTP